MSRRGSERLVRQIARAEARLRPLLPDVDPHDLQLILERLFRPIGSGRRFFLRRHGRALVF